MDLNKNCINTLIVDDNDNDVLMVREIFQDFKIINIIDDVSSGEEALAYLRKEGCYADKLSPTMVLLDINMPGMSGFDVLDCIKKDYKLRNLLVVMLTGSKHKNDIVKSYAKGACSYINKVSNPHDFYNIAKQFALYWTNVKIFSHGFKRESINILIVDDDESMILMVREAFQSFKIINTIDDVRNGFEALAYLRKEGKYTDKPTPSMVLLDVNMPGMNGFEVLDSIKKDARLRHVPVVMLTTNEYGFDVVKAYAKGACSYINKPVNPHDFFEVAEQFSHHWEQGRSLSDGFKYKKDQHFTG